VAGGRPVKETFNAMDLSILTGGRAWFHGFANA